ncbi:thioesterase II family protein [Kitasatospora griseola]|uniref:thioesterase II family protein n=1 Tax=Kitasatospora griseola TaxID=2064 RepID=UPI0036DEFF3E
MYPAPAPARSAALADAPRRLPPGRVRLLCLPYAGGAASLYRGWGALADDRVEVCPVELPGHGRRLAESPVSRLRPLVALLATELEPVLDQPFAFFGHSMGALLAFELCRELRRRGAAEPEHLFVSGASAPDAPRTRPVLHAATDEEVKQELRFLGGTPPELLDNRELMELMLPTLRADFSVLETYHYRPEPPLTVPMTVFGGTADPSVRPQALHGWRTQTSARARLEMLPGDHFFLHASVVEILGAVAGALDAGEVGNPA